MSAGADVLTAAQVRERIGSVRTWYHRIPIRPGIVTPGVHDSAAMLASLELPADCRGLRVLDLGTRDGFFAFELERRGAEVLAVDYMAAEETGFQVVAELLGSKVRHLWANVYELSPERIGSFDIVLFLGLLYHLPDPVRALTIARSLCRSRMWLESHTIDNGVLLAEGSSAPLRRLAPALADVPLMQFYPGRSLGDDPTNYWGPNLACLHAMLHECRFTVRSSKLSGSRAIVECVTAEARDLEYLEQIARGRVGRT
ncbi:MAG TPA: methyltransferase domain-containing protein [Planctomycetota bacterium]|nr:methyltransferase domain-containing protein [Planctomycetota bacterium]